MITTKQVKNRLNKWKGIKNIEIDKHVVRFTYKGSEFYAKGKSNEFIPDYPGVADITIHTKRGKHIWFRTKLGMMKALDDYVKKLQINRKRRNSISAKLRTKIYENIKEALLDKYSNNRRLNIQRKDHHLQVIDYTNNIADVIFYVCDDYFSIKVGELGNRVQQIYQVELANPNLDFVELALKSYKTLDNQIELFKNRIEKIA